MNKQELKDKIGKQMERNMYYMTAVSTNASMTRELGNNIKLLQEINIQMAESDEAEYNRGLNDAWELAQRIGGGSPQGFYDVDELNDIFGWDDAMNVFDNYSCAEALAKVQEYEKKKAEEAAKPVRGDIVKVTDKRNSAYTYGIYLGDDYYSYYILRREIISASQYTKYFFTLEKTGQHVDLEGWNAD